VSTPVAVEGIFGDSITVERIEDKPGKNVRKGAVRIAMPDGSTWVGSRMQFLELTRAMTELAVEMTP